MPAPGIVLYYWWHKAVVHIRICEPAVRGEVRINCRQLCSPLIIGKAVEVDLQLPVHPLIVFRIGVERSDSTIYRRIEHLESKDAEVGHIICQLDLYFGEVADHLDTPHIRGFGNRPIVAAAPVCQGATGGDQCTHERAFVHQVHLHTLELWDGLGGGYELDVAVAGRDFGESIYVEFCKIIFRCGTTVETGFLGRRVGLGAWFCLYYLIKDVTRTEYGKVQESHLGSLFAHRCALGGNPVTLVLGEGQVEAAVQRYLSVLVLFGRIHRAKVLLDAGWSKQHQ